MSAHTHKPQHGIPFLVHRVPASRPLVWLGMAWQDLRAHPLPSLAYGALVSALGAIVLMFNNHPYMVAGSLTAFLLVGPVMTTGLCELSRRRDRGESPSFEQSLQVLRHHRAGLLGFANRLVALGIGWMLLSAVLLQSALGSLGPALGDTVWGGAWQALEARHLMIYLGTWGLLSTLVFSISVVSVPMILDKDCEAGEAIRTSLQVVGRDLPAMLLWAAMILALVAFGFATALVGMVVVFPLLAHATWHAYRELVH